MADWEALQGLSVRLVAAGRESLAAAREGGGRLTARGWTALLHTRSRVILPVTRETVFYHYLPLQGALNYTVLSCNVLLPDISAKIYSSAWLPGDMTTTNLVLATGGLSLYLYNRQTLAGTPLHVRAGYSAYHTSMFVMGSVLSWAILARILPQSALFRAGVAVSSSMLMLKLANDSLDHIDSRLGNVLGKR